MEENGDVVLTRRSGDVATLVLNRPAKLNAMNLQMAGRMKAEIDRLAADLSVRCVVIRGAGKAFCPGADIGEFEGARASRREAEAFAEHFHQALKSIVDCPHPVVAAIRGACVGGGLQLAAICDLRIATESARFGLPVNRLGLTVDYEELKAIHRLTGEAAVLEMLLEGRVFGAHEARAKGLVNRLVADDRLDGEIAVLTDRIASGAPLVNRWHKKFVRRLMDPRPLSSAEHAECFACFETRDYEIGYRSFLAKTKPAWEGR